MESLFSWISPSTAKPEEENSSHLPPPDFLSVVRRGRRGRVRETTPTGAQSLTPLELRLKDLVLNIYSDQSSRKTPLLLSESEASEIDSGNFSDRPTTSFSDVHFHSPPSPVMTEHRSTTPIRSYDNTAPARQGQRSHLPSFFSADDTAQISEDPQLPVLREIAQSQFQFGQRGTEPVAMGSPRAPDQPSSYAVRPPRATSPPPDTQLTAPLPLSLPLYSHAELPTVAQRNSPSSSDLRSLVSRSFQLPSQPPPQQIVKQAPPPPHTLPQHTPPPPHPHPQHTPPPPHTLPQHTPPPPHPHPQHTPPPPHPLLPQAPPSLALRSEDQTTAHSTLTTPPRPLATPPASLIGLPHIHQTTTSGADTASEEKNGSEPIMIATSSEGLDEMKQLEQAEIIPRGLEDSNSVTSTSSGHADSSSEQRSVPEDVPTDKPQPHSRDEDGEIRAKTPSRGQLKPESPLSPKEIRNRLVDGTRRGKPQKGLWSSLVSSSEKKAVSGDSQPLSSEEKKDGVDHTDGGRELTEDESGERRVESASPQPYPLPASQASDHEYTLTQHTTNSHPITPSPSPPSTLNLIPAPSKYTKPTSTPSAMKMPDHLKPAPKSSSHPSLSLDFTRDPSYGSRVTSLPTLTTLRTLPPRQEEESSLVRRQDVTRTPSRELAEALHSKAHLEGQLESVMVECRELLKERAELNSRLAVLEAEMEAAKKEARTASAGPSVKSADRDSVKLREELKTSQSELKREKKAVEAAREEARRGRVSLQRLQTEVEEMKKKTQSGELQVGELREKLREATSKQEEEKARREETQHQFQSLQGSYRALEDSKSWMQGQLQETLEAKIALQEELRNVKSSSIASTVKIDQLSRENATLLQQISTLQSSVFRDKARLVTELEEIEADILSKESSYEHLLAENARLEQLAGQRASEIETLSTAIGEAQVEREELSARERERAEKEQSLTEECAALRKSLSEVERRLQASEGELARRGEDLERVQKVRLGLQERLRQSEASLISKDGALQSLKDSRDILRQELDMMKQDQLKVEGELEEERRQVARLQASLAATECDNRDEEGLVRSLTDIQQRLETENRELREKLSVREMEVKRWEREVDTLQTQVGDTTQRTQDLQRQLHSTTSDRDSAREGIRDRDSVISRLTQENKTYREETVNFRSAIDELHSRLNATLQQKSRLEGQLAEQSSLNELEHLRVAVRERTELQKQLDSLKLTHQQELLRTRTSQAQLEAELKEAKRRAEAAQRQAEKAARAWEETTEKMKELKSRSRLELGEMERAVEQSRMEKQVAEREAAPLRAELKALHEEFGRLNSEANSVRERLAYESAQKGERERESGIVALQLRRNAEERERELLEQNQALSLELERLKGRLTGNSTTQQAMRTHTSQLESALAEREAVLTRASAEVQRLLEQRQAVDSQLHTETASLREEAISLQAEMTETQKLLHLERDRVNELREELTKTTHELAEVRAGQAAEGKGVTALEGKTSRLERDRDDLRLELTTVRAQLVVAKTAAESSEREMEDKKSQVEILQQKLSAAEAQCRQTEREVEELRAQLLKGESERESSVIGGEGRRFYTSLSTIGGDEDTDSFLPATHESSASTSSYGDRDMSSLAHQAVHTAQLRELGQQIERARRQGQEAAEAKTVGEITVLRDQLGSKSRTISSLQSCLVSLKGDMGQIQHKMQSHSATVRASHHTTKQLEAQLADLKRSSSLQSPLFLSDHT